MLIILRFEKSNNMLYKNCCYYLIELNCFISGKICFSYFALHAITIREVRHCRVKTSNLKNLKFYRKNNFLIGFQNFWFVIMKFNKYIKQAIIYRID